MDYIGYIDDLIVKAEQLRVRDGGGLDLIKGQAKLTIRKCFGDESHYLLEINDIRYAPSAGIIGDEEALNDAWLYGRTKFVNLLRVIKLDLESSLKNSATQVVSPQEQRKAILSNQVFIVHGHNNEIKQAAARTLHRLGLEPIILHEQPNGGRTIMEKFLSHADPGKIAFVIVVLSPDDYGYTVSTTPDQARPRARQNVIFEMGFFIAGIGRERVFALQLETPAFELPSDILGISYTTYDNGGRWQFELVRELKNAGYDVDANKLI